MSLFVKIFTLVVYRAMCKHTILYTAYLAKTEVNDIAAAITEKYPNIIRSSKYGNGLLFPID